MATLSKHGKEVWRTDSIVRRYSYRADGNILRNYGQGWKLWRKLKPGYTMAEHTADIQRRQALRDIDRPAVASFKRLFHELVSFQARDLVFTAIQLLAGDPDGLCVEMQECSSFRYGSISNPELTLDDCVELDRAYSAMATELQAE